MRTTEEVTQSMTYDKLTTIVCDRCKNVIYDGTNPSYEMALLEMDYGGMPPIEVTSYDLCKDCYLVAVAFLQFDTGPSQDSPC